VTIKRLNRRRQRYIPRGFDGSKTPVQSLSIMAFAESETNERSDGDVGPLQTPGRRVRDFAFCSFPGLFLPFSCIGGLATRSSSSDQIELADIL